MNYFVDISSVRKDSDNKFNALSKARADVIKTLKSEGWKEFRILWFSSNSRIGMRISKIFALAQAAFKTMFMREGDNVLFQYPDYQSIDKHVLPLLTKKGVNVEFLVHDLDFMRSDWHSWEYEASILGQAKTVFVHTDAMKAMMRDKGFPEEKMKCICLFDYYSDDKMLETEELLNARHRIAFAGNLVKSHFLRLLPQLAEQRDIEFILYGLLPDDPYFTDKVSYGGKFSPDKTGLLRAGWGLIWDGDSIDTCSGRYGEYLKYNSSHKLSLYLSCGIPVIVWNESALSQWVSEKGVGIGVGSLSDILDIVPNIQEQDYLEMVGNCKVVGKQLREGTFLKSAFL